MVKKKPSGEADATSSFAHAIRQCIDTGKVGFGSNEGIKKSLLGKAKMIVLAENCSKATKQDLIKFCKLSGIPVAVFNGTSVELGTVAGRPHPVSVITVYDFGISKISEFAKGG